MREDQEHISLLIDNLPDAFAYHQIVTDNQGKPIDYTFLYVNPVFEEITGLQKEDILDQRVTDVLAGIQKSQFNWIKEYGEVAQNGKTIKFEQFSEPLQRYYEITAYSNKPGYFATIFRDVTETKQEYFYLDKLSKLGEIIYQSSIGSINYKFLTDELLELSGSKFVAVNTYEENNKKTVTRAISGVNKYIHKASQIVGFQLIGKEWDIIPKRLEHIKGGKLTRFDSLYEATFHAISKNTAKVLEKMFDLGEVLVIEILYENQIIGDFIFFMPKGKTIENPEFVEQYVQQAGIVFMYKKSEEKLLISEQKYRNFVEQANDIIFTVDEQGNYVYVSPNWKAILGYTPEEVIGKNTSEFVHPDHIDKLAQARKEIFSKGYYSGELEYLFRHKNGQWVWLSSNVSRTVIHEYGYKPVTLGIARDITEKRKAERDFINLVENSPDMVVRHDTSLKHIYANSVVEREFGISKDFLVGKTYDEIYQELKGKIDMNDPLYQQFTKMTKLLKKSAQTKEKQDIYYELLGKHFHGRIVPEIDENGEVNSLLVVTRDVTNQKQTEKELEKTKNLLEGLFESIQDGISVLNADLTIRYTNETLKIWHESDVPLEGKKCYEVYHKREVPCELCPSIKCLQTGKVEVDEMKVQTDIGSRLFELYSYPLFEKGFSEPTGVVEFVRDITDKKQAEERIRYLSFHDTLTGIYNRAYFEEEFKRLDVDRQHPISLIIADIDDLKLFNDMNGHTEGDNLIIQAADVLKNVCRREDIIARWGGDEFVILLPKTNWKTASKIAERIKNSEIKTSYSNAGLSVGVAVKENTEQTKEQVFGEADKHMYKCKLEKIHDGTK